MVDRASLAGHRSLQDWLQAVCEDHGSQVRLANAVGVSAQAVSKWMKGSRPGDQYLRRIADYFGVPYSELVQFFHPGITSGSRVELPRRLQ